MLCKFPRYLENNINLYFIITLYNITENRFYKKGLHKVYRDFYKRRCAQGPEPFRARHQLLNWFRYTLNLFSR